VQQNLSSAIIIIELLIKELQCAATTGSATAAKRAGEAPKPQIMVFRIEQGESNRLVYGAHLAVNCEVGVFSWSVETRTAAMAVG
jgi:hypothetical protein